MATQATAQLLTKGPLSSAIGQWAFLGLGTFVIFTGDNGVSKAAQQVAQIAFRLATGRDGGDLMREAALGSQVSASLQNSGPQQPIVIHSHSSPGDSRRGGWTATIIQFTLASGACWGAYIIFSNYLPDSIKEMLPVTRKFFESAVSSLGNGIISVRDVLSERIASLGKKVDELASKQDETHDSVLGLKEDIGDVRLNIDDIAVAISRCEGSLTDAAGRQTYMSRGVHLLVKCVGDLLRPSNPSVAEELDQFSRLSAELMDDEFHYKDKGGRGRGSSPDKRGRPQSLEYPSSPNLSEIGSTSTMDDHHHSVRPMSLPRPRRSQSIVTPSSTSAANNAPGGTSKMSLMGMSSPPTALKMLHSFNNGSRVSNGSSATDTTAATASTTMSRSYSCPEDEVPQSNFSSCQPTPQSRASFASEGSDPVKLDEVRELLNNIRNGVVAG